jgi:macrolide transport system ATP-binding/permease protein
MRRLRSWLVRLSGFATRARRDDAFQAELESHLQHHVDDNVRAGMPLDEARRAAVLKLGGIESTRQRYRDQSSLPVLEHLVQDLRFAVRHLWRTPGFALTAMLTLTLGIGAVLAIYAFVDAALVKPLPYADPSRLVEVTERSVQVPHANLSYPDYLDWKRQNTVFSAFAFHNGRGFSLATADGAQNVRGARVSANFFRTLGVHPIQGRDFIDGEDQPGRAPTAIIGFATWHARFGGRSDVIGRSVTLSGEQYTIVGVLPESFQFALRGPVEFWTPFRAIGGCDLERACHNLLGVARLKEGTTLESARAEMQGIAARLERQYPDSNRGQGALIAPLSDVVLGDIRPILLLLLAGAALLLTIAGINVVSLLLVRSETRKREIAVRSTLGASNARLIRQFVAEALTLVLAGSVVGLFAAAGGIRLLLSLMSVDMLEGMPYLSQTSINGRVAAFGAVLGFLALALFSLAPALRVRFEELREGLTEGARGSSGQAWRRLGFKLVVFELATAMVLLVGASLLGQSLFRLLNVNLGFEPEALVSIDVAAPGARFQEQGVALRLSREVSARVAALPGVTSVGLIEIQPVSYNGNTTWIRFVGRPYDGEHNEVLQRPIDPGYFATVGARLLRGRGPTEHDTARTPRVAVINRALARKYFANQDPIGQRFGDTDLGADTIKEIVGIVDDIRDGPLSDDIWPAIYYPMAQEPTAFFAVIARAPGHEEAILQALPRTIRAIDPDVVTQAPDTMRARIQDSPPAYLQRSSAWLVGGFAALALILGLIGLYGVVAYSVSQRTREIGLRVALGADRRSVYELILGEAGRLIAGGLAIGAVASIGAGTLIRTLLFGTAPWDPVTLVAVAVGLAIAALLASFIPAHRASSINPIEALRIE